MLSAFDSYSVGGLVQMLVAYRMHWMQIYKGERSVSI